MEREYKNNIPPIDGYSMPDSRDTETQILADLIQNPEYIPTARGYVTEKMFSDDRNAKVWRALNDMSDKGETIDLVTVSTRVDREVITEVLRPRYNGLLSIGGVIDHCSALLSEYVRRMVFIQSYQMIKYASNRNLDYNTMIALPGKLVEDIKASTKVGRATKPIGEVLNELADTIEADQIQNQNGKPTRIPTGFQGLDRLTYSGFNAGNLVILSARPSVGKTAVMLQMAKTATGAGFSSTIYSLEMSNQELAQRLLYSTGKVTPKQVRDGTFDWEKIEQANREIEQLPLYINDTASTLDDIATDIMLSHNQGRCDIAFIDYLGLMDRAGNRQPLYQIIADWTSRMKRLAKECRIPIVLLCQLNRNSVSENRDPQLYDLRDSGSIEQDADIVLMLDRQNHELGDRDINMFVRKNRHGEANVVVKLRANETFTEFVPR